MRWTAPEGLANQKFSAASDVWSFGIVCIEVYMDGAKPYPSITSNPNVMAFVNGGNIHPQPPSCTAHVYRELCQCWAFEPDQRPTFEDLNRVFASLQTSSEAGVGDTDNMPLVQVRLESSPSDGYDLGFQGRPGGTELGEYDLGSEDLGHASRSRAAHNALVHLHQQSTTGADYALETELRQQGSHLCCCVGALLCCKFAALLQLPPFMLLGFSL